MPVSNSRVPGFHRLSVTERRQLVAELADLDESDLDTWAATGELSEEVAEHMIENVVGTMSLPIGLATNFIIDGSHFLIPYVIEESSVVAAASNMAKRCIGTGGFRTNCDASIMIAQVQILGVSDIAAAIEAVYANKAELIEECNSLDSTIVKLGGGCKDIVCRSLDSDSGPMVVVHLLVDCLDAMGANALNTMAELIAPSLGRITGGKVNLRIMSNLATHRMARVEAKWTPDSMADSRGGNGEGIIQGIIEAYNFACADPYRAATHNKGVMNAISAVAVACGQDWRAVEAGCHSWVAYDQGKYGSMTRWNVDEEGNLVGTMECPMAVGIVGGASKVHPVAKTNLKLLGVNSAQELAGVLACAGLAQNLGALRALSTSGIQSGHMKLHAENMAISAGAEGEEVGQVAEIMRQSNSPITQSAVAEALAKLRLQ
jgi:hydroxymethylglutaryl-CoA reductase